jgi:hypothetical protein
MQPDDVQVAVQDILSLGLRVDNYSMDHNLAQVVGVDGIEVFCCQVELNSVSGCAKLCSSMVPAS